MCTVSTLISFRALSEAYAAEYPCRLTDLFSKNSLWTMSLTSNNVNNIISNARVKMKFPLSFSFSLSLINSHLCEWTDVLI